MGDDDFAFFVGTSVQEETNYAYARSKISNGREPTFIVRMLSTSIGMKE
jgi:hypothetical protein